MSNELQTLVLTKANFPFMSIREALTEIRKIASVADDFDNQMHILACSALHHYLDNGDLSIMSNLVKAVSRYNPTTGKFDGRSFRSADLRAWIVKYANVKWDKNAHKSGSGVATGGYVKAKTGPAEADLEKAIAHPFYTSREQTSRDLVDVRKVIDNAFKTISKASSEGTLAPEQQQLAISAMEALRPFKLVKKAS